MRRIAAAKAASTPPLTALAMLTAMAASGAASGAAGEAASGAQAETITAKTITEAEAQFQNVIAALLDDETERAFAASRQLLDQHPDFKANKMIYADLLSAYAHQEPLFDSDNARPLRRVTGVRQEIVARAAYRAPPPDHLPASIMRLSPAHRSALALDAENSRLYLFKNVNGTLRLTNDYYISIGKAGIGKLREGDDKTPMGLYRILSYLPDEKLIELYGYGAFTLNYPNAWDRLFKRDGFGIWLHGMPRNLSSRPPQDSRGCIILNNQLLKSLGAHIDLGKTVLLLEDRIRWLPPERWRTQKDDLLDAIRSWQQDWQSLEVENYLSYYSKDYLTESENYAEMEKQARKHAQKKTFVRVGIKNLDLFAYPGEPGLVTALFDQDYQSNNYNIKYRKQQFWQYEAGEWKIVYEGKAE